MAEYPTKHGDVPKSQWRIGFSNSLFKWHNKGTAEMECGEKIFT